LKITSKSLLVRERNRTVMRMKRTGREAHSGNSYYCDIRRLGRRAGIRIRNLYARIIDDDGIVSHRWGMGNRG